VMLNKFISISPRENGNDGSRKRIESELG